MLGCITISSDNAKSPYIRIYNGMNLSQESFQLRAGTVGTCPSTNPIGQQSRLWPVIIDRITNRVNITVPLLYLDSDAKVPLFTNLIREQHFSIAYLWSTDSNPQRCHGIYCSRSSSLFRVLFSRFPPIFDISGI